MLIVTASGGCLSGTQPCKVAMKVSLSLYSMCLSIFFEFEQVCLLNREDSNLLCVYGIVIRSSLNILRCGVLEAMLLKEKLCEACISERLGVRNKPGR
jgi:hypothetical protein